MEVLLKTLRASHSRNTININPKKSDASMNGLTIDRMMTTSCTKIGSAQIPFPGNALRSKCAGFITGLFSVALGDLPKHANAMFESAGCLQRSLYED